MVEKQLTSWNPVDKLVDTQYGNITYLDYYKMDISRRMEGENNKREFVIKYADKYHGDWDGTKRCCATFEHKNEGDCNE